MCQRAWDGRAGSAGFLPKKTQVILELLVRLSEVCGSSSVGAPGAQREGGVGGSALLRNVLCTDLFTWDVGRCVLCYRLSKIELAHQPL